MDGCQPLFFPIKPSASLSLSRSTSYLVSLVCPSLTSIWDSLMLVVDAFSQASFVDGDGDLLCHVCVRLLGHVNARCVYAMLPDHALFVSQPRAEQGMLQDHAIHARALCTSGLRSGSVLFCCFRLSSARGSYAAGLGFPVERSYRAMPRAPYPPNSGIFTTSYLICLPVASRLRERVCLGTLLSTGRENNEIAIRKRSLATFATWLVLSIALCFDSRCPRPRPGDCSSALPGRWTNFL